MAEGWKQLVNDLRDALGFKNDPHPLPTKTEEEPNPSPIVRADKTIPDSSPGEDERWEQDRPSVEAGAQGTRVEAISSDATETQPSESKAESIEPAPPSTGQKLLSYAGMAVTLVLAIGLGWYIYFGGPKPPAPDIVATYQGGQITVQQVRDHLKILTSGNHVVLHPTYETYRAVVEHMLLNEMVRRWAADQKLDATARFKDAMRHISESVTLDEWVARLHSDEMVSAVSESEIQTYYNANKTSFTNTTLAEVREQIRETLAHQNQEKFFESYLANLRSGATISKEYQLLEPPPPTDEQVRNYYESNLDQFSLPRRAQVDRIFIPLEGTGKEADTRASAKAAEARAALQAGKEVSEVAGKYSQEPFNPQGITIEAGKDDPALIEQAFSLSQKGDLSPLIRVQNGYAVLKLREQQPARQLSLEEARPQATAAVQVENERAWFEQNTDRTLFTIHGERFTLGQFYHEYQNLSPELKKQFSGPEGLKKLADLLIDRMLVLDDAYNKLVDQQNAPLLEEARTSVLRQMIHESEVNNRVKTVSDQDVQDFYEKQKASFATPPEVRIQSIRIALGQTEDEQKRARERAEEAYRMLVPGLGKKPAAFEEVAKTYDESDGSAASSGLGEWIRMGNDPVLDLQAHPLHEYVFSLPIGGVSQPFEYGSDMYIVKVLERTEPKPLAFEQVKEAIRAELEARQHDQLDAEVATRLLSDANTVIYDQVIQEMLGVTQMTPAP